MTRIACLACLALLLAGRIALAGTVDAARYDAFWLWAGVKPQAVVHGARTVYVLQGQIEASPRDESQVRVIAQGVALPPAPQARVWLVYRAHTLRWTPRVTQIMLAQLTRWRASGRTITGIQIDFDARTRHLQDYLEFLRALRDTLPADCRLSITGLLDWSSRIDTDQVNQLRGSSTRWSCRPTAPPHDPRLCGLPAARRAAAVAVSHRHHPGRRMGRAAVPRDESVVPRLRRVPAQRLAGKGAAVTRLSARRTQPGRGEVASTYTHAATPDSSTTRSRRYASTS